MIKRPWNFLLQMGNATFVLPLLLLASILGPGTTLAETKSFLVSWTKENNGSWFPIGKIFYAGDLLGDSHFLYSLLDYTYIHIPIVNAITAI